MRLDNILLILVLSISNGFTFDFRNSIFVEKETRCLTDIAIYRMVSKKSKILCASSCLKHNCDRLLWDSANKMCLLHSENVTFSTVVTIQPEWKMYRKVIRDTCRTLGYEFHPSLSMCYKFYENVDATWVNAQTICEEDGGNLVSISNDDARRKMDDFLKCGRRTWIGLRDEYWLNGEPFVNIFGPSTELDSIDGNVKGDFNNTCGSIVPKMEEVYVIDNSCNIRERPYFICEIKVETT